MNLYNETILYNCKLIESWDKLIETWEHKRNWEKEGWKSWDNETRELMKNVGSIVGLFMEDRGREEGKIKIKFNDRNCHWNWKKSDQNFFRKSDHFGHCSRWAACHPVRSVHFHELSGLADKPFNPFATLEAIKNYYFDILNYINFSSSRIITY